MPAAAQLPASEASPQARNSPLGDFSPAANDNLNGISYLAPESWWGNDSMHARYYNPMLGRFLSVDPIGGNPHAPQSWNRYAYVLGNPMKYIDPQGLAEIDACGGSIFAVSCTGSITVTDGTAEPEAPGDEPVSEDGGSYDPLTGVQGLRDLVQGAAFFTSPRGAHRQGVGTFNSLPYLPHSMHGMTFQEALDFAVASGAGGDCTSNPNCVLLAEAATALENPILQTILGAQEVGLAVATAGAGSARTAGLGLRFLRYPNAGGAGVNVLKNGRRVFAIDWHRFKLGGRMVNRPHFHAGLTKSQLRKHRPWQGGWKWF